jgi:hypothetical protein
MIVQVGKEPRILPKPPESGPDKDHEMHVGLPKPFEFLNRGFVIRRQSTKFPVALEKRDGTPAGHGPRVPRRLINQDKTPCGITESRSCFAAFTFFTQGSDAALFTEGDLHELVVVLDVTGSTALLQVVKEAHAQRNLTVNLPRFVHPGEVENVRVSEEIRACLLHFPIGQRQRGLEKTAVAFEG